MQCVYIECVILILSPIHVYFSALQCVEGCCSVLQCVAVCVYRVCCLDPIPNTRILRCVAVCCSVLQCVVVCCSVCISSVLS